MTENPHSTRQNDSDESASTAQSGEQQEEDDSDQNDADGEAKPKKSKRRVGLILFIVALVIGVPLGIYFYIQSRHYETTDDAFIEGHVVQVSPRVAGHVSRVYVNDNQIVKAGALLFEMDPSEYRAQVDAAAAQLKVAMANQNQAAIAVEVTSVTAAAAEREAASAYQSALAQVASNEAMLATSAKKVAEAQAIVETSRARAKQGQSSVLASKAEADRLTSDAERTKSLFETQNVSREEYDHSVASAKSAEASLQAERDSAAATQAGVAQTLASLNSTSDTVQQFRADLQVAKSNAEEARAKMAAANVAKERIQTAKAELDTAIANVGVAQAALDTAKLNESYTQVRAASEGKVTRKSVEPGNYLSPGQSVLALVKPQIWVTANFKENQLEFMNPGDPVEIEIDMYGGREFKGHVESIQSGTGSRFSLLPPENATGNFVKVVQRIPVKIVFDEKTSDAENLAPGLSVKPKVHIR